jgi:hypothetical protein
MAEMAGIRMRPFTEIHEDKANEMQRLIYEYVKEMKNITSDPQTAAKTDTTIRLSAEEFPILPDIKVLENCNQKQAAAILDQYIKHHYRKLCRACAAVPECLHIFPHPRPCVRRGNGAKSAIR